MTDDIVTRLRKLELTLMCNGADGHGFLIKHAADEIERLRKLANEEDKNIALQARAIRRRDDEIEQLRNELESVKAELEELRK